MFKLFENIVGLVKSIYENKLINDPQIKRQLAKEKADWRKAKLDLKEYRKKMELIKIYKKALWKQDGKKFGLFKKKIYIQKGETFNQVYKKAKKWLEN